VATAINFDEEHVVWVQESLDEVAAALRDVAGQSPPLVRLTMTQGEAPVLVNASLVRSIFERQTGTARIEAL
jgi:hypothetical protein